MLRCALSTSDTQRLRNQKGYVVCNWNEARMQPRCNLALLGALCGDEHDVTLSWATMLRHFERVESRLPHAMDLEFGPRLAPALFVFHLQLIERDWFEEQMCTGQRFVVPAPEFAERTFERQNNLSWLPSVSNVPALFALLAIRDLYLLSPEQTREQHRRPVHRHQFEPQHLGSLTSWGASL
jgi:hypothetical protein